MKEVINTWKKYPFDEDTIKEVEKLERDDIKTLEDSFYKNIEFGTGGMRGIMGVGTNRLNKYTLGKATQGLANYLKKTFLNEEIKVAIAYDVRHNSKEFSKITADIFSANGIKVYLFDNFRPTPELSFAVRELKCKVGIVITASHNPPEYNGYKVYWEDGGQIVPPQDKGIIDEVNLVNYSEINFTPNQNLIEKIDEKIDDLFIEKVVEYSNFNAKKNNIKIIFTPIHGTSFISMIPAFKKAGFNNVLSVEEQMRPSGNFDTVKSPNPEEPEALKMALDLAEEKQADILIGTDPDADRFGIGVRNLQGNMELLNGNQTNAVLTYFLLKNIKDNKDTFIGSTVVSSDIQIEIAKKFGVEGKLALTGFKWIGDMVKKEEGKKKIICGGEESYGFMIGDFVRDKDSITSVLLVCEILSLLKEDGKSFYEMLLEIYKEVGFYKENLLSITKKGKDGAEQISNMMKNFRENPFKEILGEKIIKIDDYQSSLSENLLNNTKASIEIPKSNVLIFYTEKGTKIAIRPSGTEPKIKFYFGVKGELKNISDYQNENNKLDNKLKNLKELISN